MLACSHESRAATGPNTSNKPCINPSLRGPDPVVNHGPPFDPLLYYTPPHTLLPGHVLCALCALKRLPPRAQPMRE